MSEILLDVRRNWVLVGNGECNYTSGCRLATAKCRGKLVGPIFASIANNKPLAVQMPCGGEARVQTTRFDSIDFPAPHIISELVVINASPKM